VCLKLSYSSIHVTEKPIKTITLKELAAKLKLSQATVSRVVNGQAARYRIAKDTQRRIQHATILYGYTANSVARSLRQKRTYTIGVMVPEISEGYSTAVLSGIEDELLEDGYFYFVASHRHRLDLLAGYPRMMLARSVEGIIAVDTNIREELPVPLVAVSGHRHIKGGVSIELDHDEAAQQALSHLCELGHKRIAFIKGQAFSSDTKRRWDSIVRSAASLGIEIDMKLVVQLTRPEPGPGPGIDVTRSLLETGIPFTAIFAFNDVTAIGAILALRETGLRVPKDVSVLGFDDVLAASTNNPPLTTIHQPLRAMGKAAAKTLLGLIRNGAAQPVPRVITVHPKLVVRKSTSHAAPGRIGEAGTAAVARTS